MKENPIIQMCREKQMTRRELARKSGVSYWTLTALAGGVVNSMSSRTASKIAKFAGKPADQLREDFVACRQEEVLEAA